jgi:hypothetical protein
MMLDTNSNQWFKFTNFHMFPTKMKIDFGPFNLRISSQAEHLDYDSLPQENRDALCIGRKFNPDIHDIYRFFVIPEFQLEPSKLIDLSRRLKRKSYDKADRALVQAKCGVESIVILGIFPTTQDDIGQVSIDLEGELLFEVTIPGIFKTKLNGKTKNIIKRQLPHSVLASRTDDFAQWVFLKSWIRSGRELGMQIFCVVPKNLPANERFVWCSAKFLEGNRLVEIINNKKVLMPIS